MNPNQDQKNRWSPSAKAREWMHCIDVLMTDRELFDNLETPTTYGGLNSGSFNRQRFGGTIPNWLHSKLNSKDDAERAHTARIWKAYKRFAQIRGHPFISYEKPRGREQKEIDRLERKIKELADSYLEKSLSDEMTSEDRSAAREKLRALSTEQLGLKPDQVAKNAEVKSAQQKKQRANLGRGLRFFGKLILWPFAVMFSGVPAAFVILYYGGVTIACLVFFPFWWVWQMISPSERRLRSLEEEDTDGNDNSTVSFLATPSSGMFGCLGMIRILLTDLLKTLTIDYFKEK